MAYYGNYTSFQTLHEDEALQIALSESLKCYDEENSKENEDLTTALRLSLVNEPQDDVSGSDTDSDCGSDPAVVRWAPDEDEAKTWGWENTLIRESDLDGERTSGGEDSLVAEKDRNEEEEEEEEAENNWKKEYRDIDAWMEFREMSLQQSCETAAHRQIPLNNSAAAHPDNTDEELSRLGYPLQNRTFTIPELGKFKLKKDFKGMASPQMIQRMLSQTSSEIWSPADKGILTSFNPNIAKKTPSKTIDPAVDQESPSKRLSDEQINDASSPRLHQISDELSPKPIISFQLEEEEQRRVQLYDNLVRAQRRYAEKLSTPCGPSGHYTKEEWNTLGEGLEMEDWEGAFLSERAMTTRETDGEEATNLRLVDYF